MSRWNLKQKPELSIMIPAHNEEAGLARLLPEIDQLLAGWSDRPVTEIILIDDGSTDDTATVVSQLQLSHTTIKYFRQTTRRGQSTALALAVDKAKGEWLATLDADGQNDPADLILLWDVAMQGNFQAVLGWRQNRQDNRRTRWVSRVANRIRNRVLGQAIIDTGCSTRLMLAVEVVQLPIFEGWHRFLGPMLLARGCQIAQLPVHHRPRSHGKSHYNWKNRGLRVLADLFGVAWLNRRMIQLGNNEKRLVKANSRIDHAHPIHTADHLSIFAEEIQADSRKTDYQAHSA
jgi:glycosyltransferase involved in cell wall biosynthesis